MRDLNEERLACDHVYHKEWDDSTVIGAEAITLLEFIALLEKKGREIQRGKIQIGLDNRYVHWKIVEDVAKPSMGSQDSGAEIVQIRRLIRKITFEIEFVLVRGHKVPKVPYQQCPLQCLIRECDYEARVCREEDLIDKQNVTNIRFYGFYAMKIGNRVVSKSVKEAMRNIDSEKIEKECAMRKFKHQ